MTKSLKKNASRFVKKSNKSLKKVPGYNIGEKGIGKVYGTMSTGAKSATSLAKNIGEKGVSFVYGTINSGVNLGKKGIKGIVSKSKGRRRRGRKTRRY